jgi:hypothetical protein
MTTVAPRRHGSPRWWATTWPVVARWKKKAPPWAISLTLHALILALLSLIVVADRRQGSMSVDTRWSSDDDSELAFAASLDETADEVPLSDRPVSVVPADIWVPEIAPPTTLEPVTAASLKVDLSGGSLAGRSNDRKDALLRRFGGSGKTEQAVDRGLRWLANHQAEQGNWSLNFQSVCRRRPCTEPGTIQSDAAATGLALLPFLGAGHTQKSGDYSKNVRRGLRWLIDQQEPSGDLSPTGTNQARMYAHGIAAIALCEAYALSQDQSLRQPAQRALDFIVAAQNESLGGWRYVPRQDSDTSVFGWQLMALQSGRTAGLEVPETTLRAAERWLDAAASAEGSQYSYRPGSPPTVTMTAEGLLCREYLGWPRDHPALVAGAGLLVENLPNQRQRNVYGWYYATQVMYHLQGDGWKKWNEAITTTLLKTQVDRGTMAGSWHVSEPTLDAWGRPGGRLYVTALSLLILEVYYRHLPLYRNLGE